MKIPLENMTDANNIICAFGEYIWGQQRDLVQYHNNIKTAEGNHKETLQYLIDNTTKKIASCKQTYEDLLGIPYTADYKPCIGEYSL